MTGPTRERDVPKESSEIEQLWEDYFSGRGQAERDRLILHYSPLVKFVAGRVGAGLPQNVEQAELISNGMFGLIDAISKFDPGMGCKFGTYGIRRIKGAILDELRAYDWVPRSVRSKARMLERAFMRFETEHHRAPTDSELAESLGVTLAQVTQMMTQVSSAGLVALDETMGSGQDRTEVMTLADVLPSPHDGPTDVFDLEEMRESLVAQINSLPSREKLVLTLYYYEGLTLAEIGDVLGVTESRICQVHTKAVLHLKTKLAAVERQDAVTD